MEKKINDRSESSNWSYLHMNPKKEYLRLTIALVVLLLILGAFITYLSIPHLSSKSIIIATQPVDPFDPLRGQYIIIGYEIGSIPEINNAEIGDTVYVILTEDETGVHRYNSASLTKPREGTFIQGKVTSASTNTRIEYGIEQYFFERNARFETTVRNVKIKLAASGRSAIAELLDEDLNIVEMIYENKTITS